VYDVCSVQPFTTEDRVSIAPSTIDVQAGPRLRAWLEAQDPPRPAEIARRAGVSRQFVSNVMAGRAKPTPAIVAACGELGLPVAVIFGVQSESRRSL
jgi:transcriptional regulator with XRE-family HTH domain